MKKNISYDKLAAFYDLFSDPTADCQFAEIIIRQLRDRRICEQKILDIGCGTGTYTLYLAQSGYRLDAIEPSLAMLKIARNKLTVNGLDSVNFHHCAIEDFESTEVYSAIVLLTDTINHINPLSMLSLPNKLSAISKTGTLLIFDMLKREFLAEERGNQTLYIELPATEYPQQIMVWENEWDDDNEIATADFTFFTAEGDLYRRSTDHVVEYYYERSALLESFREFRTLEIFDYPERELIILEKK